MKRLTSLTFSALIVVATLAQWAGLACLISAPAQAEPDAAGPRFEISFPATAHQEPITGRVFLMISHHAKPEVRLQSTWYNSPEIVAVDVKNLKPGEPAIIDATPLGTPLRSLSDLVPGDYFVQAVLNVYTEFHRADGHVIWAHLDQGEGQQFNKSPGNLYTKMRKLHLEHSGTVKLTLTEIIPPIPPAADTEWVKHIKVQSKLLSQFWGHPMYLGAVVLLPRDYSTQRDTRYPVIYYQPEHFRAFPPFGFAADPAQEDPAARADHESEENYESGYEFYRAWASDGFPRMVAASLQTTTPLSDWSGAVDSANNGPYGQAIVSELIPVIEERFRIIRQPYARVVIGKDSGGRAALALQLQHADFFGGAWISHPWPFNFQALSTLNIYDNDNAYLVKPAELQSLSTISEWLPIERIQSRMPADLPILTFRQLSRHDAVMAGMAAGDPIGADDAICGPVGADGYPKRLWDRATGVIDREVAEYWREHGDLAYYTQKNWATIGPHLVGKLHFSVGDRDEFYRAEGVRLFEQFLKKTQNPHYEGTFVYGTFKASWQPMSNAEIVRSMADHIAKNAPRDASQ